MATPDTGKVAFLIIARVSKNSACVLDKAEDLSNFSRFSRGTISEVGINIMLKACQREKVLNAPKDQKSPTAMMAFNTNKQPGVSDKPDDALDDGNPFSNYQIHIKISEPNPTTGTSLASILVATKAYKYLTAAKLTSKNFDDFSNAVPQEQWVKYIAGSGPLKAPGLDLDDTIKKAQIPEQVDAMAAIQKELDETKIVLHQTIESVLERGEKIDSLVQKSEGLSAQSKMFYTQAKKQNSCCIVM